MNIKAVSCKRHENSLFKSLKLPANVTKVPQCHKCSLVPSQKFPSDVLKVPYERQKSSLSQKSSLFQSPKFPIFVTKVPFLLALSLSLSLSLSLACLTNNGSRFSNFLCLTFTSGWSWNSRNASVCVFSNTCFAWWIYCCFPIRFFMISFLSPVGLLDVFAQ